MSEIKVESKEENKSSLLDTMVGLCVVLLATFLGICNVKDGNIVQKMQQKQADHNDNWAWYQARNIRQSVYQSTADELSLDRPGETPEAKSAREKLSKDYLERAKSQEKKMLDQEAAGKQALEDYNSLNNIDDKFDLCEACLAIALALMGVTALSKRWWMFFLAMVPSVLGVWVGVAGFMEVDPNIPFLNKLIEILS